MRTQEETCKDIAASTDEERGNLIRRVQDYNWTPERKEAVTRFIMLLGLAGSKSKKQ